MTILFWTLMGLLLLLAIVFMAWPLISPKHGRLSRHWPLAAGLVIAVGAGAIALYSDTGTPGLVDAEQQQRPEVDPEVMALIEKLEKVMEERPNDPKGWLLLARAYTKLGEVNKAIEAYRRVVKLDPDNIRAAMAMGGLMVASSGGRVPPEAMEIFQKIAETGSAPPMVQFYLGMGHMQNGDTVAAYDAWSDLAEATPPGAPWIPMLRKNLTKLAAELDRPVPDLPEAQPQQGGQ